MNITQKHRYGLSAMVQLGFYYQQGPVQLRIVAEEANIPHAFLEQLMLDLKKNGLVISTRGSKGGYQLAQHPSDISVEAIFSAIDPLNCVSGSEDSLSFFWSNLNSHINQFLNLRLQSIIQEVLKKEKVLTYSI